MKINTVTVIGANGTMGRNVSAIFASFGNARVYMVSRSIEKSEIAIDKAYKTVRTESIKKNMIPADYTMLEKCIRDSDLVFESTVEDLCVKLSINRQIAKYADIHTVCCTGTSGLSITTLAECFPETIRKNYMGIHMFNPPYNLTLCEMIPTPYTNRILFNEMMVYAADVLRRTVVEVKDSPAFLGNRIGFQFMNEALQYAAQYKYNGGIDYIDALLGPFTGRTMAPLVTSDFVGLDVHQAIVNNLYTKTNDYANPTFLMPDFAVALINKGNLGRKSGGGLYKTVVHDNGMKLHQVYDIKSESYREVIPYTFPFIERMIESLRIGDYALAYQYLTNTHSQEAEIVVEFLLKYIIYALYTASMVGYHIDAADDVMATGFNWCPPMAMIQALSGIKRVNELIKERISVDITEKIDIEKLLSYAEPSKYDYRKFIKARH